MRLYIKFCMDLSSYRYEISLIIEQEYFVINDNTVTQINNSKKISEKCPRDI